MLEVLLGVLAILGLSKATYVPGTPGIQWTEDQASIIQVIKKFLYFDKVLLHFSF